MQDQHNALIVDQFTRQAAPYSSAAAIRDEEALNRIVRMAEAGPDDTVLDVACGPGLLACAFAPRVRHVTGIDLTPAMLDQARKVQAERGVRNVSWREGDVLPLPYADGEFSIVNTRFAFHHFLDPLAVLKEMRRVAQAGGRVVVTDSAPAPAKAAAFNTMEKLRDPSHVRAMPPEELRELFARAGFGEPRVEMYRLRGELEGLLERSFPNSGDRDRIRRIFEDSLSDDALDMETVSKNGKILFSFPVAILAAVVPMKR
jgi:ubiquinone/menaquinone biosynthesis C-methylase UbiE